MVRVVWWRARVQRARVAVRWGSVNNLALVLAASPRYFLHDWLPVHTSSKRSIHCTTIFGGFFGSGARSGSFLNPRSLGVR